MTHRKQPFMQAGQGESINWGLRASNPDFDGSETVTCDLKIATADCGVPDSANPPVASATVTFVPAAGDEASYYQFSISPEDSAALPIAMLITDARVEFTNGEVEYPDPILINVTRVVTAG